MYPSSGKELMNEVTYAGESVREAIDSHCWNGVSYLLLFMHLETVLVRRK
jgi:hypothetical protein